MVETQTSYLALLVPRFRISENSRKFFGGGNFRNLYGIDHLPKGKGKIGH